MKFCVFSIFSLAIVTDAKLGRLHYERKLSVHDVGSIHTEVFHKLGQKYSKQKPKHTNDVIDDIHKITSTYCPNGNNECLENTYKAIVNESKILRYKNNNNIVFPGHFDTRVKKILDNVHETVNLSNMENIKDILKSLTEYQNELQNIDDVDVASQMVGIASVSVAIESTKLWHKVFIDSSHPLHDMIGYFNSYGNRRKKRHRRLDDVEEDTGGGGLGEYGFGYIAFDYIGIVQADIESATEGGLASFQEILAAPFIIPRLIGSAIMGSGRAAFADIGFPEDLVDDYLYFNSVDNDDDDNDGDGEDDGNVEEDEDDDDDNLDDDDFLTQLTTDQDDFTADIGIQDGLFFIQDQSSVMATEETNNVIIEEGDDGGKNDGKGEKNGGKNDGGGGKNGGKNDGGGGKNDGKNDGGGGKNDGGGGKNDGGGGKNDGKNDGDGGKNGGKNDGGGGKNDGKGGKGGKNDEKGGKGR